MMKRAGLTLLAALGLSACGSTPADRGLSGTVPPPTSAAPEARAAIRAYQRQNGLLVDGRASATLLAHLRQRHLADR